MYARSTGRRWNKSNTDPGRRKSRLERCLWLDSALRISSSWKKTFFSGPDSGDFAVAIYREFCLFWGVFLQDEEK